MNDAMYDLIYLIDMISTTIFHISLSICIIIITWRKYGNM